MIKGQTQQNLKDKAFVTNKPDKSIFFTTLSITIIYSKYEKMRWENSLGSQWGINTGTEKGKSHSTIH